MKITRFRQEVADFYAQTNQSVDSFPTYAQFLAYHKNRRIRLSSIVTREEYYKSFAKVRTQHIASFGKRNIFIQPLLKVIN